MKGEWTALSWSSSRCAMRPKVRRRTSPMTSRISAATGFTLQTRSYELLKPSRLQQPAEPGHGERGGREEQDGRAAGEGRGDLVLLGLRGQPRAQPGVDVAQLVGLRGGERLAAGDAGDLLQALGVRRHLHALEEPERVAQLHLAARRAQRDGEDRDVG